MCVCVCVCVCVRSSAHLRINYSLMPVSWCLVSDISKGAMIAIVAVLYDEQSPHCDHSTILVRSDEQRCADHEKFCLLEYIAPLLDRPGQGQSHGVSFVNPQAYKTSCCCDYSINVMFILTGSLVVYEIPKIYTSLLTIKHSESANVRQSCHTLIISNSSFPW